MYLWMFLEFGIFGSFVVFLVWFLGVCGVVGVLVCWKFFWEVLGCGDSSFFLGVGKWRLFFFVGM